MSRARHTYAHVAHAAHPLARPRPIGVGALLVTALLAACGTRGPVAPGPTGPVASPSAPATPAPPAPRAAGPIAAPPTPPLARAPFAGPDGPDPHPPPHLQRVPDAVPRIEPLRAGSPNAPYAINGQTYRPRAVDEPVHERGVASWYGRKFHGQRTANGEVYNMYAMTAAHPTLPIPSYARVRNRANGREVIVRINDRGPFKAGRIIDLSYTAALKLGFVKDQGTAQVELERLTHEAIRTGSWRNPNPLADPPSGGGEGWAYAWLDGLWSVSAAVSLGGRGFGRAAFAPLAAPLWARQPEGLGDGSHPGMAPADDAPPASDFPDGLADRLPDGLPAGTNTATTDPGATPAIGGWWLQLGAASPPAAALARQRLESRRDPAFAPLLTVVSVADAGMAPATAALQAGPFPTREEARTAARRLAPATVSQLLQRP